MGTYPTAKTSKKKSIEASQRRQRWGNRDRRESTNQARSQKKIAFKGLRSEPESSGGGGVLQICRPSRQEKHATPISHG